MGYSWFPVNIGTDKDGKPMRHPAFQGCERLSIDGTMWMCHDELLAERHLTKAKVSTMPSALTLQTKITAGTLNVTEAVCSKDETQTKNLLETANWKTVEVIKEPIVKEEVPIIEEVIRK